MRVTHAGCGFREGEEQQLIEQSEDGQGSGSADGRGLECDVADGCGGVSGQFADGDREDCREREHGRHDDTAIDYGGHETQAEECSLGREDWLEGRFGNFDKGRDRLSREQNGRPLRREGFDSWRGRHLSRFHLEDAELGCLRILMLGLIRIFAQRTLGQAGTGFAGSDELAGKLDQIGRNVDGSACIFECGRLTEGDFFIESQALSFVECILRPESVRSSGSLLVPSEAVVRIIEPDSEAGVWRLRGGSFGCPWPGNGWGCNDRIG